eukprot:TRINITY_DN5476_c4_g1_i4.p2 TRINITY_DN5476_c4_g1~~TRINITY_DN5476_c4_g1_i4.p2  ORF type:complete len:197 (-),score=-15.30 TRINITY_DN5476_c4_g1_i4:63-653(-)
MYQCIMKCLQFTHAQYQIYMHIINQFGIQLIIFVLCIKLGVEGSENYIMYIYIQVYILKCRVRLGCWQMDQKVCRGCKFFARWVSRSVRLILIYEFKNSERLQFLRLRSQKMQQQQQYQQNVVQFYCMYGWIQFLGQVLHAQIRCFTYRHKIHAKKHSWHQLGISPTSTCSSSSAFFNGFNALQLQTSIHIYIVRL